MAAWFDRTVGLVLLLACGILAATAWQRGIIGRTLRASVASAVGSTEYKVGERIRSLEGIDFAKSTRTLVAFVETNCQFCVDSTPLYRAVADVRDRVPNRLQFIAAGVEPIERLQAFVARYRLRPDRVVSVSPTDVNVRMTPTLVLVDRTGIVMQLWVGEQTGARGEAILEQLRAIGH